MLKGLIEQTDEQALRERSHKRLGRLSLTPPAFRRQRSGFVENARFLSRHDEYAKQSLLSPGGSQYGSSNSQSTSKSSSISQYPQPLQQPPEYRRTSPCIDSYSSPEPRYNGTYHMNRPVSRVPLDSMSQPVYDPLHDASARHCPLQYNSFATSNDHEMNPSTSMPPPLNCTLVISSRDEACKPNDLPPKESRRRRPSNKKTSRRKRKKRSATSTGTHANGNHSRSNNASSIAMPQATRYDPVPNSQYMNQPQQYVPSNPSILPLSGDHSPLPIHHPRQGFQPLSHALQECTNTPTQSSSSSSSSDCLCPSALNTSTRVQLKRSLQVTLLREKLEHTLQQRHQDASFKNVEYNPEAPGYHERVYDPLFPQYNS